MFAKDNSHNAVISLKEFTYTLIKESPDRIFDENTWNSVLEFYRLCPPQFSKQFPLEELKNELTIALSSVRKLTENVLPLSFWSTDCKRLNLIRAMFSVPLLTTIIDTCTQLVDLNLDSILKVDDHLIQLISQRCPHIQKLSLEGCRMLTDTSLHYLLEMKELRELNLGGCFNITTGGLYHFLSVHPNKINFVNIHLTDINDTILNILPTFCPKLETLTINFSHFSDPAFISFIKRHKFLRSLSFAWSSGFTDECLYAIAYGEELLETLDITGCESFTATAIFELLLARCKLLPQRGNIAEQAATNAVHAGYIQSITPLPERNLRCLFAKYDDIVNTLSNCMDVEIVI